jgi:hypothetical protein
MPGTRVFAWPKGGNERTISRIFALNARCVELRLDHRLYQPLSRRMPLSNKLPIRAFHRFLLRGPDSTTPSVLSRLWLTEPTTPDRYANFHSNILLFFVFFFNLYGGSLGTAATTGLLYQPRMVIVKKLVDWRLAGATEILGENLPQRHFVHHTSHMTRPGFESGQLRWEASD